MSTVSTSVSKPPARKAADKPAAITGAIDFPLSQLRLSEFNIRHPEEGELAWEVEDLEASILAVGLISPLGVHPQKKPKDTYGVFAGGRRLHALQNLLARGDIAADYPVPCMVRHGSPEMLIELSVIENVQRVALRPTVEYEAFRRLADAGADVSLIAVRFATTEAYVRQRMQLGRLHPDILGALSKAAISEDLARAYASTADQALQIRVYREITEGYTPHVPRNVRNAIRGGAAAMNADHMLEVVGIDAYVAAGGSLEEDMFEGGHRVVQIGTLSELYYAKVEAQATELAAKLPPTVTVSTSDVGLGRAVFAGAEFADEERDRLTAIDKRTEEISEELGQLADWADDDTDAPEAEPVLVADRSEDQARVDALQAELGRLEDESEAIQAAAKPVLPDGPVVAKMVPSPTGPKLEGYYRPAGYVEPAAARKVADDPSPRRPADDAGLGRQSYESSPDPFVKEETGLTQDGIQVMRSHRRAVLRAMVIEPGEGQKVGGRYLVFSILRLALQEYKRHGEQRYPSHLGLFGSFSIVGDPIGANEVDAQPGAQMWGAALERVKSRPWMANRDLAAAFAEFCDLDDGEVEELAAIAGALLLDRSLRAPGYKVALHDQIAFLTGADADIDIRELYWRPDAAFFAWLPKARCIAAVEQISEKAAKSIAKLSKDEIDQACERFFRADPKDVSEFGLIPAQAKYARMWVPDWMRFSEGPPPIAAAKGNALSSLAQESVA